MNFQPKIDQSIYLDGTSAQKKFANVDEVVSAEQSQDSKVISVPVSNRMNSIFKLKNVDLLD
jgi:hypothetical protein